MKSYLVGDVIFVNRLDESACFAYSLYILAGDRETGREQLLDCVLASDRVGEILDTIRDVLGSRFSLVDCWEAAPPQLIAEAEAA